MSDETKETIQERAARVREELRDGRKRAGETANATSQDARNSDSAARGSIKVLPGKGERTKPGDRHGNSAGGGAEKEPERVGHTDRRSGDSDEGTVSDVQGSGRQRRVGRFVSEGPIPERLPEYEQGPQEQGQRYRDDYRYSYRALDGTRSRVKVYYLISDPNQTITPAEYIQLKSRKQEQQEQEQARAETAKGADPRGKERRSFFGFGKEGSVLSKSEVNALREPFIAALKDDCKYLDQFLWWYSKDASQPQIWSNMADEEIETLATVLLHRGERNAATATFVRNVVEGHDYLEVAIILVPRFIETGQQMGKRPKQPKRERVKR